MPRKATRIVTAALALSVVLLALAAAIVYVASERRLNARHPLPISTISVPQDAASIERGRHLFRAIGSCTLCHGEDGGGRIYEESALLGVIAGPNLTRGRGGVGTTFRDADWDRAIRFGLHADGRSLLIMPSEVFVNMSDDKANEYFSDGLTEELLNVLANVQGLRVIAPAWRKERARRRALAPIPQRNGQATHANGHSHKTEK